MRGLKINTHHGHNTLVPLLVFDTHIATPGSSSYNDEDRQKVEDDRRRGGAVTLSSEEEEISENQGRMMLPSTTLEDYHSSTGSTSPTIEPQDVDNRLAKKTDMVMMDQKVSKIMMGGERRNIAKRYAPIDFLFSRVALLDIDDSKIARELMRAKKPSSTLAQRVAFEKVSSAVSNVSTDLKMHQIDQKIYEKCKGLREVISNLPLPSHHLSFVEGFLANKDAEESFARQRSAKSIMSQAEECYKVASYNRFWMTLLTEGTILKAPAEKSVFQPNSTKHQALSDLLKTLGRDNQRFWNFAPKTNRRSNWHEAWINEIMPESSSVIRQVFRSQRPINCSPLTMYLLGRLASVTRLHPTLEYLAKPLMLQRDIDSCLAEYHDLLRLQSYKVPMGESQYDILAVYQIIYSLKDLGKENLSLIPAIERVRVGLSSGELVGFDQAISALKNEQTCLSGRDNLKLFNGERAPLDSLIKDLERLMPIPELIGDVDVTTLASFHNVERQAGLASISSSIQDSVCQDQRGSDHVERILLRPRPIEHAVENVYSEPVEKAEELTLDSTTVSATAAGPSVSPLPGAVTPPHHSAVEDLYAKPIKLPRVVAVTFRLDDAIEDAVTSGGIVSMPEILETSL